MSLDAQESILHIRDKDFPLPSIRDDMGQAQKENMISTKILITLVLALYALEDPRVDDILRKMNFKFVWPDGKKVTSLFD